MSIYPEIPSGSTLGLNYSGMHDSAIAIVAPDGTPLFAAALERFSRVKQDGRPPFALIDQLPWQRISKVAISTENSFEWPLTSESQLLQTRLKEVRSDGLRHDQPFYDFLERLPCEKEFVCHQLAHAASAFWGSGFGEALCLTYDGGMCNSPWFGGLYAANRRSGIRCLDQFSALHYAKVTSLYTFVTALLGFTPNKHEGKITGLAAYGKPTDRCRALLNNWFEEEFAKIESVMEWVFAYSSDLAPMLLTNDAKIQPFRNAAQEFSREELAATVQEFAELHVLELLDKANALGWSSDNICLAGGLFANVKINQRVVEAGFSKLFVAPPMTDDGTALGAAWHVLSRKSEFRPQPLHSMCLGASFTGEAIKDLLERECIQYTTPTDVANKVAELLAAGSVVAVFQGKMEFGPRALGNRSILAQATRSDINHSLNERLNRTEFMPFAPVSRFEDAASCYLDIDRVSHAAEFMTVTVNCTESMAMECPAVVHIDGTARPQLVSAEGNPFIHAVLTQYKILSNKSALVNTSFNIHEEPIVCSPEDALHGFFESGLDWLYLGYGYLISFNENKETALKYVQSKLRKPSQKSETLASVVKLQSSLLVSKDIQLSEKEKVIRQLDDADGKKFSESQRLLEDKTRQFAELQELLTATRKSLNENKELLAERELTIKGYCLAYGNLLGRPGIPGLRSLARTIRRASEIFKPRLGNLNQYAPRPLSIFYSSQRTEALVNYPKIARVIRGANEIFRPRLGKFNQYVPRPLSILPRGQSEAVLGHYPRISIVTPSFWQGGYIEKTLLSVLDQRYSNLEYFVQDGGSNDSTTAVLKAYNDRLSGWESKKDSGQSQAINRGFANTNGEIMAWLNSDDLLLPGALHTVADYFNRHPEVDVVYGNRIMIDQNDLEIGRWIMPGHDREVLSWVDYIPQETMFWRRRIWDKVGAQVDESFRFAMDWDLLIRFRDAGAKFANIPVFLGAFRIHDQQKTSCQINEIGRQEMDRIRERALGRVPTNTQIRKATLPYLLRHVAVDMLYRIDLRLGGR